MSPSALLKTKEPALCLFLSLHSHQGAYCHEEPTASIESPALLYRGALTRHAYQPCPGFLLQATMSKHGFQKSLF